MSIFVFKLMSKYVLAFFKEGTSLNMMFILISLGYQGANRFSKETARLFMVLS